jgi:glycosyltransferase involved in cell wall biosynthesis
MLAGCIPVVSKCGALPEVVGDCGIYLDTIDPQAIAKSVSEALEFPDEARLNARTRVLREFTISRRQGSFEALLEGPEPWP